MKNLIAFIMFASFFFIASFAETGCAKKEEKEVALEESPQEPPQTGKKVVEIGKTTAQKEPVKKPVEKAVMGHSYSTKRLEYARTKGLPERYNNLSNPMEPNADNIKSGSDIYRSKCALCHGSDATGNSPAGKTLKPPASNLTLVIKDPVATEQYLFWTITEGGKELDSAMPSFLKSLKEEDRWKVIIFLKGK